MKYTFKTNELVLECQNSNKIIIGGASKFHVAEFDIDYA